MQLFNSEISDFDEIMRYYEHEYAGRPFDYDHFLLKINGKVNSPMFEEAVQSISL